MNPSHFSKSFRCFLVLVATLFFFVSSPQKVIGQLHIAPTALYLDNANRTGRITVKNASAAPVEIETELLFGHPATNEEGNVYLKLYDSVPGDLPSALDWIRAYPRHFILKGGERQTIRFAARPPSGLPQGEYWLRPAIVSYQPNTIEGGNVSAGISASIGIRKRSILSLNYRQGQVQTGVEVVSFNTEQNNGLLQISAELLRKGNAAYIGHYEFTVTNSRGSLVHSEKKQIAVYTTQNRTFKFNTADLTPDTYTANIELSTKDRTKDGIIQVPSVTENIAFTVK